MKAFMRIALLLAAVFPLRTVAVAFEDISPHFSTNMPIVWQAPTNHLPKGCWTYKKLPAHP
jgi:hypothetical protein